MRKEKKEEEEEEKERDDEGLRTCCAVVEQLESLNIEMPICEAVYSVFYKNVSIDNAIHHLMTRDLKNDWSDK